MLKHKRILSLAVVAVLCILSGGLEAQAVTTDSNVFPVQGGVYELQGPVATYPGARLPDSDIDIELVSMSLTHKPSASTPPVDPPPVGGKWAVDSFFDITVELYVGSASDFAVDSFFDVFTELSIGKPPGTPASQFDTEILSMDLTGEYIPVPGTSNSLQLRLSPTIPSIGGTTLTDLGTGQWNVDSFFDVFTELSVDGGPWRVASGPIRMVLPEPATMSLLVLGGLAMLRRRRK